MLVQSARTRFIPTDSLKSYVKSLLRFNATTIVDETGAAVTHNGGGVNTSIGKFGGSFFMWFYASQIQVGLTLNANCNWNWPEFTYEFWFKPELGNTAETDTRVITQLSTNSLNWFGLAYQRTSGNTFNFGPCYLIGGVYSHSMYTNLNSNNWNFVSIQKGVEANKFSVHINGNFLAHYQYPHTLTGGSVYVGNAYSHNTTIRAPQCYVDELRFTAKARYGIANYTPPTQQFPY